MYGSDAIAGVVNFILKRDFEGLELNAQAGISERGDNGRYSTSLAFGRNFADGRGNIALVGEYSKIESVLNSQRPEISGFGRGFRSFITVDSDTELTNSDGNPDTILADRLVYDFISEGGTVASFCRRGFEARQPTSCPTGNSFGRYRFGQDGRLFYETNGPIFGSFTQGGTGSTLSDGSLIPDIERYNINLLTHFDVSDAFRPYLEAKYARIEALGQGTPTFFNSFCGGLNGLSGLDPSCTNGLTSPPFFIRFDNPYLNPADAAVIRNNVQGELLRAFGAGGLTAASQGFFINRNNSDFGTRNDSVVRETYRVVAGVEGDIAANTRYDVSFNYGRFESELLAQNQIIYQNTRNALDAVRAPSGQIVCRINADADPSNDDPACSPLNVLGAGAPSQAALDYILVDAGLSERAEQYNALAYISSDFPAGQSARFSAPNGAVKKPSPSPTNCRRAGRRSSTRSRCSILRHSKCSKCSANSACRCLPTFRSSTN